MACKFLDRTGAYLDRELPAAEREEYEAHLAMCGECPCELKRLERLSRFFSAATSLEAGPEQFLWKPRLIRQKTVRFAELLMAAAALVMAVCGIWLLEAGPRSDFAAVEGWEQMAVTQQADPAADTDEDERLVQALLRGKP